MTQCVNWQTTCWKPCTRANGVGLAATQVDVHKRMIVLDVSEARDQPLVLINPEILTLEGKAVNEEGCLSLPGIYDKLIARHAIFACARSAATASRSKWMRTDCWPSASNTKWIISRASYSSITCPSSSVS